MTQDKDKALEKYECVNCGKCCLFLKQQLAEQNNHNETLHNTNALLVEEKAVALKENKDFKRQLAAQINKNVNCANSQSSLEKEKEIEIMKLFCKGNEDGYKKQLTEKEQQARAEVIEEIEKCLTDFRRGFTLSGEKYWLFYDKDWQRIIAQGKEV